MKVKTLIVGLGNPGQKYEKTRHNIGFMVLDALSSDFKFEKKFNAEICIMNHGEDSGQARMTDNIILMKPQTFMNLSGEAVKKFADYYKIKTENIWVIHDDIDIPFGEVRIRKDGSSAGHKGIESVIQNLGTNKFWRFRVGVKNGDLGVIETEDFVLQRFEPNEEKALSKIIEACTTEIKKLIVNGGVPGGKILKIK